MTKPVPHQSRPKAKTSEREALDQCELFLRELLDSDTIGLSPEMHQRVRMLLGFIKGSADACPGKPSDLWQAICTAESALRFIMSEFSDAHLIGRDAEEARSRARYALLWITQSKCPSDTIPVLDEQGGGY